MAWTTPRTYTIAEFLTKAILDVHIRDNFAWLHGDAGDFTVAGVYEIFSDAYVGRVAAGVPGGGSSADKMAFQRHPYGNRRHLESGSVTATSLATMATTNASVTFTDAFSVAPNITTGVYSGGDTGTNTPTASISGGCWFTATSTTGFTIYMRNHSNGTLTLTFMWMAEGVD